MSASRPLIITGVDKNFCLLGLAQRSAERWLNDDIIRTVLKIYERIQMAKHIFPIEPYRDNYQEQTENMLPVLGDMLNDARCDQEAILNSCFDKRIPVVSLLFILIPDHPSHEIKKKESNEVDYSCVKCKHLHTNVEIKRECAGKYVPAAFIAGILKTNGVIDEDEDRMPMPRLPTTRYGPSIPRLGL